LPLTRSSCWSSTGFAHPRRIGERIAARAALADEGILLEDRPDGITT
jgi:hypothetical protein